MPPSRYAVSTIHTIFLPGFVEVLAFEDFHERGEDHSFKRVVTGYKSLTRMRLCKIHELLAVFLIFFF
jgi:hypothetical protein